MPVVFVPIPSTAIEGTERLWLHFIEQIAERGKFHVKQLVGMIESGEVQIHFAWDDKTRSALALAGTRIIQRGDDRIAELIWTTGSGREHWLPLFDDLERYCREHLGCAGLRANARPGWAPFLKTKGYRVTHVLAEKDF